MKLIVDLLFLIIDYYHDQNNELIDGKLIIDNWLKLMIDWLSTKIRVQSYRTFSWSIEKIKNEIAIILWK